MNAHFLPSNATDVFDNYLKENPVPSDIIQLTYDEISELNTFWNKGSNDFTIPSDIIFAGTLPILDSEIIIDERCDGGLLCRFRIAIFDNYLDLIDHAKDNPAIVGFIYQSPDQLRLDNTLKYMQGFNRIRPDVDSGYIMPIAVRKGNNNVLTPVAYGIHGPKNDFIKTIISDDGPKVLCKEFYKILSIWYGVQLALLHPLVKDVIISSKKEKNRIVDSQGISSKKSKARYIKHHMIRKEDILKSLTIEETTAVSENHKCFHRKTMCWYVIGHWRQYADGHKKFIQPYWKGPLHEIKKGSIRDRELIINK